MTRPIRVHLTGTEISGWALDADVATTRTALLALEGQVELTSLEDADVVHSGQPRQGRAALQAARRALGLVTLRVHRRRPHPAGVPADPARAPQDSRRLGELLRQHDLYIAASRNDPYSNALLEALASGLPALYLDEGGHGEFVGHGGLPFKNTEDVLPQLDRLN